MKVKGTSNATRKSNSSLDQAERLEALSNSCLFDGCECFIRVGKVKTFVRLSIQREGEEAPLSVDCYKMYSAKSVRTTHIWGR